MDYLIFFILFLFGIAVGSFLNVLVYRLESGYPFRKIIFGYSFCPNCKNKIFWYDMFPVASFFILGGRCRQCDRKISFQYPLIELMMGFLFVAIYFLLDKGYGLMQPSQAAIYGLKNSCSVFNLGCYLSDINLVYLLIIFSGLFTILVYDVKHYIIPNKIIYPLIIFSLAYGLLSIFFPFLGVGLSIRSLYAILAGAGFFAVLIIVSRGKWMGMGDVRLAFFMGLFLSWPNILVALISSFWLGALVSLPLLMFGRKNMSSQIPFGPFLILGTFVAYFWGGQIIDWYIGIRL